MIIWTNEKPTKIGKYLVLSEEKGNINIFTRVDIEYWNGYCFDDIDPRNNPIKWSYINEEDENNGK